MSVLSNFGGHFVGSYPMDFGNLLGHQITKPHHHHIKVANHGRAHWHCALYKFIYLLSYFQKFAQSRNDCLCNLIARLTMWKLSSWRQKSVGLTLVKFVLITC